MDKISDTAPRSSQEYQPPRPGQGVSDNPYSNDADCNEPGSRAMRWHNDLLPGGEGSREAATTQPSSAGQGDTLAALPLYRLADDANGKRGLHRDDTGSWVRRQDVERALAARQPVAESATLVDSGALRMALNVLRRAGKIEVADELEKSAIRQSGTYDDEELQFYREHVGSDLDNMLMAAGVFEVTHEGGYKAAWSNSMDALERLIDRQSAQAVDLDTLKAVSDEYNEWILFHDAGNGSFDDFLKGRALIDSSKAVQP